MGEILFWPGYEGAAILDFYAEKTLGRVYRMDPKKLKWRPTRAKFFYSSSSQFTKRFDVSGVRIAPYSLRAPFTFDVETSGKVMTLRVKGKLSFATT